MVAEREPQSDGDLQALDEDDRGVPESRELGGRSEGNGRTAVHDRSRPADLNEDSVGMYLRDIGAVGLLDRADERVFGKHLEAGRRLKELEAQLSAQLGRAPDGQSPRCRPSSP